MKTKVLFSVLACLALVACSKVGEEKPEICGLCMKLLGGVFEYDQDISTKATSTDWTWEDGSTIYIGFDKDGNTTSATAVYDATEDSWYVSYPGTLAEGVSGTCKCYYFENTISETSYVIQLDQNSVVYEDAEASYNVSDGTLVVNASLKPMLSRIRINGAPDTQMLMYGISTAKTFRLKDFSFTMTTNAVSTTIESDGYSPYVYGLFATADDPYIILESGDVQYYTSCSKNIFQAGQSGFMTMPTALKHNGWETKNLVDTYTVNGVSFKMILVAGGEFQMGGDDAAPVHKVTLTKDYYIAETECTEALWYAVKRAPESYKDSELPVMGFSYAKYCEFIETLNDMTGMYFRLPTEAEWEYAAKGGNKSIGYLYSGSDSYTEVTNSQAGRTYVKSKKSNELGIFDMSGNVSEYCSDYWYSSYSSAEVVDPIGPSSGSAHVLRGGSFNSSRSNLTVTARYYSNSNDANYAGLRLVLEP